MRGIEHIPWLYDSVMRILDRLGLSDWRRQLVRGASSRTLEVGCGTGRNLPLYSSSVQVIGLDLDPAALARARQRSSTVPLVVGTVEALPFRADSFDTVVSSLVFCSVDDPLQRLHEIRRVLRAEESYGCSSTCVIGDPLGQLCRISSSPFARVTGGCHPNRDTEAIVERAGFRINAAGRAETHVLRRFSARPAN